MKDIVPLMESFPVKEHPWQDGDEHPWEEGE